MADERTYIMIKPDGVQRGLVGEIISRFEKKGFFWEHSNKLNQVNNSLNNIIPIFQQNHSSLSLLPTCFQAQLFAWSGKEKALLLQEEKCLVRPTPSTLLLEPSEEISALMLEETSATVLIQLNLPRRKLLFGSNQRKSTNGNHTPMNGFTNDLESKLYLC